LDALQRHYKQEAETCGSSEDALRSQFPDEESVEEHHPDKHIDMEAEWDGGV